MVNKPRQLGTAFENLVKGYLRENGFPEADREDFSSPLGDIKNTPSTLECKDRKSITLGAFLIQVKKSDEKTGRGMPVVVVKKKQANIKDAYFVTDLEHGALLLKALEIVKGLGIDVRSACRSTPAEERKED